MMMEVVNKISRQGIINLAVVSILLVMGCSRNLNQTTNSHESARAPEYYKQFAFMGHDTERPLDLDHVTAPDIVKTARTYLGVPHCMGGKSQKCTDCSGLLVMVFANHGIQLPHNSQDQARYGSIIQGMNNLKTGDLVFFIRTYKSRNTITHSGIYLGNQEFIHTSSKLGVTVSSLQEPYWNEKFIFGTRIFGR